MKLSVSTGLRRAALAGPGADAEALEGQLRLGLV